MPEKSGMDATLCGPALGGPSCCPQAGPAAAANVTNKSKFRGTFMSTSPHELLGLPRPRPGAGAIVYPKCGHSARNVFVEAGVGKRQRYHHGIGAILAPNTSYQWRMPFQISVAVSAKPEQFAIFRVKSRVWRQHQGEPTNTTIAATAASGRVALTCHFVRNSGVKRKPPPLG